MLLVIDANELFSAIIKDSDTAKLLMSRKLTLIAPEFILSEFKKHENEVLSKTHRSFNDFSKFLYLVEDKIKLIPSSDFEDKLSEAKSLCKDVNDIPYIALALKYNCEIWSEDKELKQQSKVTVYNTSELIKLLGLKQ